MRARQSANAKWVVCGRCGEVLAQRTYMPAGVIGRSANAVHVLVWGPEWRNDKPGKVYRGPRVKRGWRRAISGRMVKPNKSFPLSLPAECPRCADLNELDALTLDVSEIPPMKA